MCARSASIAEVLPCVSAHRRNTSQRACASVGYSLPTWAAIRKYGHDTDSLYACMCVTYSYMHRCMHCRTAQECIIAAGGLFRGARQEGGKSATDSGKQKNPLGSSLLDRFAADSHNLTPSNPTLVARQTRIMSQGGLQTSTLSDQCSRSVRPSRSTGKGACTSIASDIWHSFAP